MIIYANSRKSGKTTEAIKLAASTHSLLIVPNQDMVHFAERQAREMNYPVHVMSAKNYFNPRNAGRCKDERIVIDELDSVLRSLFGCEVIMATTTGCTADIEINETDFNNYRIKHTGMQTVKPSDAPAPKGPGRQR
ncbi:hypothetical protein [Clostridium sp.]|uniref:hypothetical protein n=1 Tax=Clostridium sp. TaxID=1506 RepID=UPI001A3C582C|nr:hypothetical protein [Clostridium sp.]MBK5236695.1 hypothetical protein [Clostridium sp.]